MNDDTLLLEVMSGITFCLSYSVGFQVLHWLSSFVPLNIMIWLILIIIGISLLFWLFWRRNQPEIISNYIATSTIIGMLLGVWL